MFESTIPFGEPELMRVSAFRSYLQDLQADFAQGGAGSRLSSLGRSLMADLARFERDGGTTETVEVLAACVRHAKRATLHLQWSDRVLPLTVFPQERLVHCPVAMDEFLGKHLAELRVLHVEPALLRPPGTSEGPCGEPHLHHPLGPVLWELALRGLRNELLPEIAGPAAYRIAPGLDLSGLKANATLLAALARLRQQTTNLRDIAQWPGFDRSRAVRLLNALYLQGGLIVSRSHPDAISESWFSVLGR